MTTIKPIDRPIRMKTLTRQGAIQMLNKVPEVTFYFWVIKIMATTVGET